MIDFKFLDKLLNYVHEKNGMALTYDEISEFTKEENNYLQEGCQRLVHDGYAEQRGGNHQYFIIIQGILELDKNFLFMYEGKPYQREQFKEKIRDIWTVLKMVAIVLNGLALLTLAVYTAIWKD